MKKCVGEYSRKQSGANEAEEILSDNKRDNEYTEPEEIIDKLKRPQYRFNIPEKYIIKNSNHITKLSKKWTLLMSSN